MSQYNHLFYVNFPIQYINEVFIILSIPIHKGAVGDTASGGYFNYTYPDSLISFYLTLDYKTNWSGSVSRTSYLYSIGY